MLVFNMYLLNKINNIINFFINIKNIFIEKSLYYFFNKNNNINKKNVNDSIHNYLIDLSKEFKNNKIKDIELLSDILYLYYKYNNKYISENENENIDMKYYILGWYIYQTINANK